jgi:hypothetical protein
LVTTLYGLILTTLIWGSSLVYSDAKIIVDLILPAKNNALDLLSKKIADNPYFTLNSYINTLPTDDTKGNILIIVSEKLLPLLSNSGYQANFALYVNSIEYRKKDFENTAALFSDQPLFRQVSLIEAIFNGEPIQLGIAYQNKDYEIVLDEISATSSSMKINIEKIGDQNIVRSVNKIIQKNDVLLSITEDNIYNSETIRPILLSSYRHQTVVIGPTEGFVNAGALGTVLSTPDQYISDIIDMVYHYIRTKTLPPSQHTSNFTVKINYSVSKSLGLNIPSEEELKILILDKGIK